MNRDKPLISPKEVTQIIAGENIELDPTRITLQTILITQRRYIQPAIGKKLYNEIIEGKYNELTRVYIKPALALFIARAIIYNHTIRIGAGGVAIPIPINHVKPSKNELSEIMNTLKKGAETLLKIAVEYIITSNAFPEFNNRESTNGTSTNGGIIII